LSSLPPVPSNAPAIPLSDDARQTYQDLYDQYEAAIQASNDPAVILPLRNSQMDLRNVLTKDNMCRIESTTALLNALLDQIKTTNDDLVTLKAQIAAIASKISTAADIIAAIDKVLSLSGIA